MLRGQAHVVPLPSCHCARGRVGHGRRAVVAAAGHLFASPPQGLPGTHPGSAGSGSRSSGGGSSIRGGRGGSRLRRSSSGSGSIGPAGSFMHPGVTTAGAAGSASSPSLSGGSLGSRHGPSVSSAMFAGVGSLGLSYAPSTRSQSTGSADFTGDMLAAFGSMGAEDIDLQELQ